MATILRELGLRHQWLYDSIVFGASLTFGGEFRLRHLALEYLRIAPDTRVLDLCCGGGQATKCLAEKSHYVTGLDISEHSIAHARRAVPEASFIVASATDIPFPDSSFDIVHTSLAFHEMTASQIERILAEAFRVLKPGGTLTVLDFHYPHNAFFRVALFFDFFIFETETAWDFIASNFTGCVTRAGFTVQREYLHAGGSFQVLQASRL